MGSDYSKPRPSCTISTSPDVCTEKPLVAIVGISSRQGRSIAEALLQDGNWRVRGLARNASKVQDLSCRGVDIIEGDVRNRDDLSALFEGAYAAFAITSFWEAREILEEVKTGKEIVDVAKEKGVQHFVYSTLLDADERETCVLSHFSDKARVEEYARKAGFKYTTFPSPAFFYQNFQDFFPVKEDDNGDRVFGIPGYTPETILTAVDSDDIGKAVVNALNNPTEWNGKFTPVFGTCAPFKDYIATYERITGNTARIELVPAPTTSGGKEMQEMICWCLYGRNVDLGLAKKANPMMKSFEEWVGEGNL